MGEAFPLEGFRAKLPAGGLNEIHNQILYR